MKVIMFHVERYPVQEPAPHFRPAGDEVVNFRVDNLERQRVRERRYTALAAAVNANLQPFLTVSNADFLAPALVFCLAEKDKPRFTMANKVRCCRPTKRLAATQVGQRLKNAGLSGGVRAVYQIEAVAQLQVSTFQATKVADFESTNHRYRAAP